MDKQIQSQIHPLTLEKLLEEQSVKFPISRLVLPVINADTAVEKDATRNISLTAFRTREYSPSSCYKNLSREIPVSTNEDH